MNGSGYSTREIRVRATNAVARGLTIADVAESFGVSERSILRWTRRIREGGLEALARKVGSGRPRSLGVSETMQLCSIVARPASEYGFETDLWTVSRVRQVVEDKCGIVTSDDTVWRRLRDAGLTYQTPARRYFQIDEEARRKWLRIEAPKIRETARKYRAIVYFEDEANVSLTPVLGKTWAPRGQTPRVTVTGKRGGFAAMSAISGTGRLVFRLYQKRIASPEVIEFLGQMLKHHSKRHLVIVMDQARPHTSKATTAYIQSQPRLHVFYLPPYSPDWNPDEKVWNHLKNCELKAHRAKTQEELFELTKSKLNHMANTPSLLHGLFLRCCMTDFLR